MGRPSALRVLLWGERPQCRAERRLLFKLDLVILVSLRGRSKRRE